MPHTQTKRSHKEPSRGIRGFFERVYGLRRRLAIGGTGVLACALFYHVVCGQNGITVYEQKRHESQSLDKQLERLTQENESLQGHVDLLRDDPGAIEHQAREELHYTRPGEVIVTLPNEKPATAVNTSDSK